MKPADLMERSEHRSKIKEKAREQLLSERIRQAHFIKTQPHRRRRMTVDFSLYTNKQNVFTLQQNPET